LGGKGLGRKGLGGKSNRRERFGEGKVIERISRKAKILTEPGMVKFSSISLVIYNWINGMGLILFSIVA
jgi:hypothetical protein